MRAVTLADVAARAGVSGKTVSRVVNRDPNVSQETRRRIEAAIAETGFRPNTAARSLAAARSYLIGTFSPNTSSFYHAELFRGIMRGCRALGYHLVVEEVDVEGVSGIDRYDQGLRAMRCDGIVLPPPLSDDAALLKALDSDGVRYVRLAPATDVARAASIFADDAAGVTALATHLWAQGHRHFGIVLGPMDHASTPLRRDAFIAAVISLGGQTADVQVVNEPWQGSLMITGRSAGATLLDSPRPPTAIFTFNDELAVGVMTYARELGLDVPGDLAVAGFDDSDAAMFTWPPLTTIRQPIAVMGERAVEVLAAPAATSRIDCSVELIVRGSTQR
ncbi:LacI family DNA-binding transcriptional regulator [Sphingomonas sp.]|uniref:LacI family DNA-binding transcriptional regulator n=1 Tax=Sphingomonas sp. TaxID=28214 RepID=UPI0031E2F75B